MPLLLFLDAERKQSVVDVKLLPEAKKEKMSFRIQYDLSNELKSAHTML